MKQTVLHEKHLQLNAKMTDFQGWQVPQSYADVADEYHAVHAAAGFFDISFLGRIEISGAGAAPLLELLFTRNISGMAEKSAHYGLICNEAGGILDDEVLFRLSERHGGPRFLLTTNALNTEKILLWLRKHAKADAGIADRTQSLAQLSLQGPQSPHIVQKLLESSFKKFKQRAIKEMTIRDTTILICRTGYTGEHGYEFFIPASSAGIFWDAILEAGKEFGIMPCGLATRDILRIEAGYPLYGNDIDEKRNPIEAGLGCFLDFKKNFIGRESLLRLKASGTEQKLAPFVLIDKSIPRPGGSIYSENREIGTVTSGAFSPSLRKGIGLGYLVSRYSQAGQEIEIEVRDREIAAKVVDLPFCGKK